MYSAQPEFSAYGLSHWAVIALFVVGSVFLIFAGRRQTEVQARHLSRVLGGILAVIYGSAVLYSLSSPTLGGSVPLQLTDLATVSAIYALWSHRHWPFALTYYWGLVLSTQALISPALAGPDFPGYEFLAFWAIHLFVVWAAIYLTWGRRMRPTWRSYRLAVLVTLTWAIVTFIFNRVADTNYGFLNAKPSTASLLDLMGPWPVYLFSGMTIVFVIWALMTWPWERDGSLDKDAADQPMG